jgi:hypothetical protein
MALVASLFTGCSKHSPQQESATAHPKFTDLGIVEVSDGVKTRHDLGGGRVCIIAPAVQKDGSVLLALSIEESGRVLATPRAGTMSDRPIEVSVGDIGVKLTPHIKP